MITTALLRLCLFSWLKLCGSRQARKDTDVALQIIAQASSDQLVCLLLLAQAVEGEPLHGQCLCKIISEERKKKKCYAG